MKKNCHNCVYGRWDSDWDELSYRSYKYFVCDKRDVANDDSLQQNLYRWEYLEKAKQCCELPNPLQE